MIRQDIQYSIEEVGVTGRLDCEVDGKDNPFCFAWVASIFSPVLCIPLCSYCSDTAPFLCKMSRYDDRYRGSDRRDDRGGSGGHRGGGGGGGGRGGDGGLDAGATRLYVGRLSTRTRSRDLEDLFAKYGRYEAFHPNHLKSVTVACVRFMSTAQ
jgi:hypothetical protein